MVVLLNEEIYLPSNTIFGFEGSASDFYTSMTTISKLKITAVLYLRHPQSLMPSTFPEAGSLIVEGI